MKAHIERSAKFNLKRAQSVQFKSDKLNGILNNVILQTIKQEIDAKL